MSETALAAIGAAGWMVKHQVPGRVRLQNSLVRGNESLAEGIRKTLCALPGVRDVAASPVSGSVLVFYDEGTQSLSTLIEEAQAAHPLPVRQKKDGPPQASKNAKSGGQSPPWMSHAAHGLKEFAVSLDQGVRKNTGGKLELRQIVLSFLLARVGLQGFRAGWAAWETVENALEFIIAYTLYHHPDVEKEVKEAEDVAEPGL